MHPTFTFANERGKRSPIGLTSLIDVVFILLLFFMLTSTFSPLNALNISPAADGAGQPLTEVKPLVIGVIGANQLRIGQSLFVYKHTSNNPELAQAIRQNAQVLVQADTTASVQHLVSALTYLEQTGVKNLHLGESRGVDNAQ